MSIRIPSSTAGRCQLVPLGRVSEQRGTLCVAQVARHVAFEIQRVYWIFDVPAHGERAHHAHREQHELLVAARGSFTVHCDDGAARSTYVLDSPDTGLLLAPMVFHHLDSFSPDALCLVLASGPYQNDEYVHDRREFLELLSRR